MRIDLHKLPHRFIEKPLLAGRMAMEHYGLRKAGADAGFVVSDREHDCLYGAT